MSDKTHLRFVPAESGTRLLAAVHDDSNQAAPVFFVWGRVIAWEVFTSISDGDDDPRCTWAHPVTVGDQGFHQNPRADTELAVVFADGRVEHLTGDEFIGTVDDWKAQASRTLIERPERMRAAMERAAQRAAEQAAHA